jgi:hypothetical protein
MLNLTQKSPWPDPTLSSGSDPENGPVFVTVEYRVQPGRADEFVEAIYKLELIRRRDGATQWGLFQEGSTPKLFLEEFIVESWLEHLRQHERMTVSDLEIQARVDVLHIGPEVPRVTHYIAVERPKASRKTKLLKGI